MVGEQFFDEREMGGAVAGDALGRSLGSYSNPMNNFSGNIYQLTDTEELLFRLECSFRGESVGDKDEIVKVGRALLNDEGIKNVVGIVRSAASQSVVMSDFDSGEIKNIMEYLNDTLSKDLLINRINYDITNPSARDSIVFMANACCFAILKRGYKGGERRFWKGSQQEISIKGDNQKKPSFLGGLFKK